MTPEQLSPASAVAAGAVARRRGAKTGVVHFGPGAFHRVHQAWYFDQLLKRDKRWGITGVSLKSSAIKDALAPQEGLYVLTQLERERSFEVIGALTELLVASQQRQRVLSLLVAPDTGWVSITITEKGYCLDPEGELDIRHPDIAHDLASPREPRGLIGYLLEGLRLRRAQGLPPPVIVSCDNLSDNGRLLRQAVLRFAGELDRSLADWIAGEVAFPRTMVDAITPASDDALRALVKMELNVADAWPVQREGFLQWVIEDCLPPGAPDLASVGVEITSDVGGYERAKLRLLNGAHSALAYLGLLRGYETVLEAILDPVLAGFIMTLMQEDISPHVRAPSSLNLSRYIAEVLVRFQNPAIRHLLAQIAWDGSKKLPFRLLETVREAKKSGRPIDRLCLPIAAWMVFVSRQAKIGILIVDPLQDELARIGSACTGTADDDVRRFLKLDAMFPAMLAEDEGFREHLARAYRRLTAPGPQDPLVG